MASRWRRSSTSAPRPPRPTRSSTGGRSSPMPRGTAVCSSWPRQKPVGARRCRRAATRAGATPLQLAAVNGNAAIIAALIKAGADPNAPVTKYGDTTLMMAARTGNPEAVKVLLDNGATANAVETWGGTTALLWAVSESHPDAAKMLIDRGANVNVRSKIVPSEGRRGGSTSNSSVTSLPRDPEPGEKPKKDYYGGFTPLHFAVRQGDMESTRRLVAAGADVNTVSADGKASLELAIYNGNYEIASFLIDNKAQVN